jgi:hypothetical protein
MGMKTIGRIDMVDLPEFGIEDIPAKIDTGANRSSIHCSFIREVKNGDLDEIEFRIPLDSSHGENILHSKTYFKKKIRSSSGHLEERYVIKTTIVLFGRKIRTTFSLSDRAEMKYPVLLGRKLLRSRFVVDVEQQNLSYNKKIAEL